MANYSRKTAILALSALVAMAAAGLFAARIEAREPRAGIALPENYVLGGEPGEDPHLKTKPRIFIIDQSAPVADAGCGDAVFLDEYSMDSEGLREGKGRSLCSRVNLAWRVFLRTWFRQLHR